MIDGRLHRRDHFNGQNIIQILRTPVFINGRSGFNDGTSCSITTQLDVFPGQCRCHLGEKFPCNCFVDQKRLQSIANAWFLGLGIHDNFYRHFLIGIGVNIGVTDAIVMLDDGHSGKRNHGLDQPLPASWNDQVKILVHPRHHRHALSISEWNELNRPIGKTGSFATRLQGLGQRPVRMNGLGTSPQDRGIARLQTQNRGITGYIRTALVNDANHPDGDAKLLNANSVGTIPFAQYFTHRIRQGGHFFDTSGHCLEPFRIKPQTVQHRRSQPTFLTCGEIPGIGLENLRSCRADTTGHRLEDFILLLLGKNSQGQSCRPGFASHFVYLILDFLVGHWRRS